MCLAIPGEITKIDGNKAVVDFGGIKRNVDLSLLEEGNAIIGDYVLVHVGFAIQKVDKETAMEAYRLLSELEKND